MRPYAFYTLCGGGKSGCWLLAAEGKGKRKSKIQGSLRQAEGRLFAALRMTALSERGGWIGTYH
jgi:hypothetical protein